MDRATFWQMAFAQVCGIQFHPANHVRADQVAGVVSFCADVADAMTAEMQVRISFVEDPCQSE